MHAEETTAVQPLPVATLGEHYRRYRLADVAAEQAMARSLVRYGQLAPIVVCLRQDRPEVLDGFKRQAAARLVPGLRTLSARILTVDEQSAKAAIFGLNSIGSRPHTLEEAWIVQALVRDDGLSQVATAALLGRHKSWVCRRLALLEKLAAAVKDELRLGLLPPSLARQLTRLPAGNQEALLAATRREALSAAEVRGVVDLLQGATPEQERFLLQQPREALRLAAGVGGPLRDPRLSAGGNHVARQLSHLVEAVERFANWLQYPGRAALQRLDRELLQPRFVQLQRCLPGLAERLEDFLEQLSLP
jgi:ParB family transcriptional regulator, chromosome partitioning protein